MQWTESTDSGVTLLHLEGEIDLHSSPELRAALKAKVASHCPALVIDFTAVPYLDSSGLATLIEYWRDSQPFAGRLALAGVSEQLRTIFEISRLGEILKIFTEIPDAVAAVKA